MDAATHRDRLNVLDLADEFEVHAPGILSRHFDHSRSARIRQIQIVRRHLIAKHVTSHESSPVYPRFRNSRNKTRTFHTPAFNRSLM